MKLSIRLIIALFSFSLLISCKKSNKDGALIPANSSIAMVINGEHMLEKLPLEEVRKSAWYRSIEDSSLVNFMDQITENPDNTGMEMKANFIAYLVRDTLGGYFVFTGPLKDKEKFAAFADRLTKSAKATTGDISYMVNNKMMATWNSDRFATVIDMPQMAAGRRIGVISEMESGSRELKSMAASVLSPEKDKTLAKNEQFDELMESKGDLSLWVNVEEMNRGSMAMAALSMMNVGKLYEGSLVTAAVNFNNGEIDVESMYYGGKEMTKLWKKYKGGSVDKDMLSRMATQNLAFVMALNFKPEAFKEFISLAGLDGMITMATATAGFTFDDFIKGIKGDILFGMTDLKKDTTGTMNPEFIFSSSINDKPSFNKLIDAGKKLGERAGTMGTDRVAYRSDDKYFAIGNSKPLIEQFFASSQAKPAFMNEITETAVFAYADLQYIMRALQQNRMSASDSLMLDASAKIWDKLIITGGNYDDDGVKQKMVIRMVDKNTNSLKQMNNYFGELSNIQQRAKRDTIITTSFQP